MLKTLEDLIKIIRERKSSSDDNSYTSKLLKDKSLSLGKVKEEIGELIEAVENNSNKVHEAADVLYHLEKLRLLNLRRHNLHLNLKPFQTFSATNLGLLIHFSEVLTLQVYKICDS